MSKMLFGTTFFYPLRKLFEVDKSGPVGTDYADFTDFLGLGLGTVDIGRPNLQEKQ